MSGFGFTELLTLALIVIPLAVVLTSVAWFALYSIYLIVKDRVLKDFHLHHKNAH